MCLVIILYRIVLIDLPVDKCRHSQVDKKKLYVIQVISYRHWDKDTCSNSMSSGWKNSTFPGFRGVLHCKMIFSVAKLTLLLQMSVCPSVCLQQKPLKLVCHYAYSHHANQPPCQSDSIPLPPQPLRIITICHHAYQQYYSSSFTPISYHTHQPWCQSAIRFLNCPQRISALFVT